MIQYEYTISGRVQGVNFRQYVTERARQLGVKGWVKNLSNGDVRAMAQGNRSELDTFEDYLKNGPSMARVENISKNKIKEPDDFSGFTVRH